MTTFTVHLPRPSYSEIGTEVQDFDRAVFVPEKFSWGAFIFGPLWLLSRGLWIAFLAWLAAMILLIVAASTILSGNAAFWVFVAIELFLGLEGNGWRRGKLMRRGYRFADIIVGRQRSEAERGFFMRRLVAADAPAPAVRNSVALPHADSHNDVLGHFPTPEGRG